MTLARKRNYGSFGPYFSHWADVYIKYGTIHGLSWYTAVKSVSLRNAIFTLGTLAMATIPFIIYFEAKAFLGDKTVRSSTEWLEAGRIDFPNLTVCHPLYFSKAKMDGMLNGLLIILIF